MVVTTQNTVDTLLDSLKSHCPATYEHSIRVGKLLKEFTSYLGIEDNKMFELGALHDCGKLPIPYDSLTKRVNSLKQNIRK